ncbi:MAG: hypothetical protein H0V76_04255 [Blastocatellia bacterium]|nr:hypothetical protein [Blastocatellia bacterium]
MKIAKGESVIAVLHSPREKLLGILGEINASGVFIRGIDLSYFEDWCSSIVNDEPFLPMSEYFVPMWRVERIVLDEGDEVNPSMTDQFLKKTGQLMSDY